MNANELIEFQEDQASEARANGFSDVRFMQTATMLRTFDGQLAFRIDAITKYQAWIKELEISKQSWEIIAKGYGKTIDEQQAEIEALKAPKIPLLEQEIRFILGNGQCWTGEDCSMPNLIYIIRAVEAAHGIGV